MEGASLWRSVSVVVCRAGAGERLERGEGRGRQGKAGAANSAMVGQRNREGKMEKGRRERRRSAGTRRRGCRGGGSDHRVCRTGEA